MQNHILDDRPERELERIFNPSAPLTEEALENFIEDTASVPSEKLSLSELRRRAKL